MVAVDKHPAHELLQAGQWSEARAEFEAALQEQERPDLLEGMADALIWSDDIPGGIDFYRRAYTAYRREGEAVSAAFVALSIAVAYKCFLGNHSAARGWIARAETAAGPDGAPAIHGWLSAFRGYLITDEDLATAEELLTAALSHARDTADRDLELVAMSDLGVILAKSGRVEEGMCLVDEAMAGLSAGEYARLQTVIIVCCSMLVACEFARDFRRALQWCSIADQFHERYGCPFLYAECRAIYGHMLLAAGRWIEAERELTSAETLTRDIFPAVHVHARAALAELRLRQGRLEDAEAFLSGLEHETATAGMIGGALKLARRQPASAIRTLALAQRRLEPQSIESVRVQELLIEAYLASRALPQAVEALTALQAVVGDKAWPEAQGRACLSTGRLAAFRADTDLAVACFEDAIAIFARLGLPYEEAIARLALAHGARDSSPDLAIAEADRALAGFRRLGAHAACDKASALLRSLGQAAGPGPRGQGLLTMREQEVLSLLRSGLSNPEIAERLVISRKTAAHHVSSLLGKLGLRNRAEAVAYATRTGG